MRAPRHVAPCDFPHHLAFSGLLCYVGVAFFLGLTPMAWFLTFAACVFGLYFWIQYLKRQKELNSPLAAHRLGHSHIGRVVVLEQGLQNGTGRVRIGDREWAVRGPNLPAGARARVTGVDGTVLLVDRTT